MRVLTSKECRLASGGEGVVTVVGNDVYIGVTIAFGGPAATPANIAAITASMEARWSGQFGQYNVHTQINVVPTGTTGALVNTINLVDGPTNNPNGNGNSYVKNGHTGEWSMDDLTNTNTHPNTKGDDAFNHELGHLLGLDDGEPGSEIMDGGTGEDVGQADIDAILDEDNTNTTKATNPASFDFNAVYQAHVSEFDAMLQEAESMQLDSGTVVAEYGLQGNVNTPSGTTHDGKYSWWYSNDSNIVLVDTDDNGSPDTAVKQLSSRLYAFEPGPEIGEQHLFF